MSAIEITEDLPFKVLRKTWQPVAVASAIGAGQVRAYRLLGEEIAIARLPGGLLAAQDACPHKGFRLSLGQVCDGELRCSYHGWRFDREGRCTNIPSLLQPLPNKQEQARLTTYEIRERYGMIWVRLDPEELAQIPDVPEFENSQWTYLVAEPMVFEAGFRREIENYLDMTHFAFAHSTTLGVSADPKVPTMKIAELADGFEMEAPFPALASPKELPGKLQQAHARRQRCWLPNFTTIRQSFADGDERVLVHIPSPNSAFQCTVFWALAISPGFKGPAPSEQMEFAQRVLDEDRRMCEHQVPREVPVNPAKGGWGVLVTPGDNLANMFQRTFRKFLLQSMAPR